MGILTGATTWLRRIVDIALIALIVIVLAVIALGKVVPLTGRQSIIIGGGSMEPAIHLGSAVVVSPVAAAELVVGDVVSMKFDAARTTYTHRIVAVVDRPDGRWIRTKGDANADPDPTLVPASSVIGRVDVAIPLMGYLLALLSMPIGVIFTVGLAATLLAMAWLLESLELAPTPRRTPAPTPSMAGQLAPSATGLGPAGSVGGTRVWVETAAARPTVAEQIARSRQRRSRHARWVSGDRRRSTAD